MNYKEMIREITESFFVIFTVAIIGNGILSHINGVELVPVRFVFDILLVSVLTSLAGVVLYSKRELNRGEMLFRHFLHFVLVLGIALAVATYMRWVQWSSPTNVIGFAIFIILIYATVHAVIFLQTKKLADKLNEKLKERYKR